MDRWTYPPELRGCWAKIQRADESITNLKADIAAFFASDPKPYEVIRKFSPNGRDYLFLVRGDPWPPLRFSVIAGEIIHHMRSSLDHLVTALVDRNRATPTENQGFPICRSIEAWTAACNDGRIQGVARAAKKIIGENQPYRSGDTADTHPLVVIHDMDIKDKHRLLTVTVSAAQLGKRIVSGTNEKLAKSLGIKPGREIIEFGDGRPRQITVEGAEVFKISLAEPDPTFEAEADIVPHIAFEKCGRAELVPVVDGLTLMLHTAAGVLDQFKGQF